MKNHAISGDGRHVLTPASARVGVLTAQPACGAPSDFLHFLSTAAARIEIASSAGVGPLGHLDFAPAVRIRTP
ncbi:MAG: hypothetical protein WD690_13380, partial [Vicinamibacterales bacterium]